MQDLDRRLDSLATQRSLHEVEATLLARLEQVEHLIRGSRVTVETRTRRRPSARHGAPVRGARSASSCKVQRTMRASRLQMVRRLTGRYLL